MKDKHGEKNDQGREYYHGTDEYKIPWYKRTDVIVAFITLAGTLTVAIISNYPHAWNLSGSGPPPVPSPSISLTPSASTPASSASSTSTFTPAPSSTLLPTGTEGINLKDMVDWKLMESNFAVTDIKTGRSQYINTIGAAYDYDSIIFIVEAKRSFYETTIYMARFYDGDQIEIFSSLVNFEPSYSQWQTGDRSRGNIELPEVSIQKKVNLIKITQFP